LSESSQSLALRSHFSTPEQQRETATLGMWIFLATEILFFGGLFASYAVYRAWHPAAFERASAEMSIVLGSINTAVLICSSFTMAMAVHSAQEGIWKRLVIFLLATVAIGAVFLGIKFTEYYQHYQAHEAPGFWFMTDDPDPGPYEIFFVYYFAMTGLHAVHMIIGIGLLLVLTGRSALETFGARYHNPIVITGLYWHFVDIVWVFLFAIFYLPGLHLQ
jgi:cytochrome c oxidase subunit 3